MNKKKMYFADSNRSGVISFNEFCYVIETLNGKNSQQPIYGNPSRNPFYYPKTIIYIYDYTTSYDSNAPGRFIGSEYPKIIPIKPCDMGNHE